MSVRIVSTGGTIASTEDDGADANPDLTGDDLVAAVPALDGLTTVETEDFATVPSPYLSFEDLLDLVDLLRELDADPEVDGVVVTQGTDNLEETSYFVDCCYDGETPVAFTGAMRTPSHASPDGPANLLAGVRTVLDDSARDRGVLVVFNDRVHAAREVVKAHSMNVDTFRTPEFGPLATVDEDRLVWRRRAENPDPTFSPTASALPDEVLTCVATLDMSDSVLELGTEADAVCLAAMGAGHVPPKILSALETLRDEDVPVVATTRCPEGRLARRTYGFRGSERTLQELGCYYSDLNLQKTRVKAVLALAEDRLSDAFDRPTPN
ncbi:asparaginase [Haloprofundus halophilus]|uniref:asparaginase n=1 Tax=Haloprofundus halophilus TaxID=2283527 RepID=UPI000E447069|nr:asparaginase [Haloprofundus halophilus]